MLDFFINLSEKLPSLVKDIIISIFLLVLGYFFLRVAKNIVVRQLKKLVKIIKIYSLIKLQIF